MKIDLHNYEAFFLDHKEGNLGPAQEQELLLFLDKYPHLKEELNSYEEFVLGTDLDEDVLENKNLFKRKEFTDDTLIAFSEGILDERTKKEIGLLASQNDVFKKELSLYKSVYLKPDLEIKFKNKSGLKRGGVIISLQNNYTFLRVAAAVLLLIGLFFLVSVFVIKENAKVGVKVAENEKPDPDSYRERNKNQEAENKKPEVVNENKFKKNLAFNSNKIKLNKRVKEELLNNQAEKQNVVANAPVNADEKNSEKDSLTKLAFVQNNAPEIKNNSGSYFNYSPDKDDENEQLVTASTAPAKRSFFNKIVKAAKNVNSLGVKNVNSSEENNANSVIVGGLVVSETRLSQ